MNLFEGKKTIRYGNRVADLSGKMIMGILNLTPDSFYPGSRIPDLAEFLKKAEKMISDGADILDIGGYSTRPGAEEIPPELEAERILEPIRQARKEFPDVILSIDTFRPQVAEIAINEGIDWVNDISAGEPDEKMFDVIRKYQKPYIIMHMKGTPANMQTQAHYSHLINELLSFFAQKTEKLRELGINDILIDPGFGFGKTITHNFEILRNLKLFKVFNYPLVVGLSRKSMIYKTLASTPDNALNGTTAMNTIALLNGADILRVHDVKEAKEIVRLLGKYEKTELT